MSDILGARITRQRGVGVVANVGDAEELRRYVEGNLAALLEGYWKIADAPAARGEPVADERLDKGLEGGEEKEPERPLRHRHRHVVDVDPDISDEKGEIG